jgi:hypothetical protein
MNATTKNHKAEIKLCLETIAKLREAVAEAEKKGWENGGLAQTYKAHLARFEAYLAKLQVA